MSTSAAAAPAAERAIDADWIVARYEAVRSRLPAAAFDGAEAEPAANLSDLFGRYAVFALDGYGVLNVGARPIAGAAERVAAMRAAGVRPVVLTNAATLPRAGTVAKYRALGFDFAAHEIVSSRDVAVAEMARLDPGGRLRWGVAAPGPDATAELPGRRHLLLDDAAAYDGADAILLLSSYGWTGERQDRLVDSLVRRARPVLVANPDLVAPQEVGVSLEPGFWAHDLADRTGIAPVFCGKPFGNAFAALLARLGSAAPEPHRIAMVGDTLHTDILGGRAAGFGTVLVTGHGVYAGHDAAAYVAATGIVPDVVMPTT